MSSAVLAITLLAALPAAPPTTWLELEPGLSYRLVNAQASKGWGNTQLHVFRVDLKTHQLVPIDARTPSRTRASVKTLAEGTKVRVIVNGTYFDERNRPLGLLVGAQRELNPLRRADWGVFYVTKGRARLVHTTDWRKAPPRRPEFAIQVGPRCVVDGQPLKLKRQVAKRAALGDINTGRAGGAAPQLLPV